MRQFIVIIAVMVLVIGGLTQDNFLWSYRLFLEEPVIHKIDQGEYLSQLSQKYYGTTDYWKELALINRAPKPDLVFPEENILIPDISKMRSLKNARSISDVNKIVKEMETFISSNKIIQEKISEDKISQPSVKPIADKKPETIKPEKAVVEKKAVETKSSNSGMLYLFYMLGIFVSIGLLLYFFLKRSKGETNEKFDFEDLDKNIPPEPAEKKTMKNEAIMAN